MKKQTAGRKILGELAPKFASLNDDVLFGEVWSREDKLSLKTRSMITISALMAQGLFPQLKSHLILGKEHGVTKEEVVEIITQLAFYCGWPKAWSAFGLVEEVYQTSDNVLHGGIFGMGEPNTGFSKYFIGNSYLKKLTDNVLPIFNVTFEPGCRNNWHTHKAKTGGGQVLIVVEGEGWYQEENEKPIKLKVGDIVAIKPNIKHWHGATKDSWFSHLAIEVPGTETSTEWLEEVNDKEYNNLR